MAMAMHTASALRARPASLREESPGRWALGPRRWGAPMAQTLAAGHTNRALHHGHAYARREPEKTALYQVFHRHLPGLERMWVDADSGNRLPVHVTEELQQFLTCGILSHGFAQMQCDVCHKRHLVAFSCKGRGFCPSCGTAHERGRREPGGPVLPEHVPICQWVLTLPYPLRYPLNSLSWHRKC